MKIGALSDVRLLFQTAIEQSERSGLPKILEKFAEMTDACGCILWQVAAEAGGAQGRLFVLADWFPGESGYSRLHNIPLRDDSAIGQAILSRRVVAGTSLPQDQKLGGSAKQPLDDPTIKWLCVVPIDFHDGAVGAVSLYRTSEHPFSDPEISWVGELARMVPGLYQAHRDRVSLNLLAKVNDILHDAEIEADGRVMPKEAVRDLVQRVCQLVGDSFNCIEASVFLEDALDNPGVYDLVATTCAEAFEQLAYECNSSGLTAWVLRHATAVKIFDLAFFKRDREDIQRRYPNLEWHHLGHTVEHARQAFNLGSASELPPLSFIATPIVMGGKVHGVIRCCIARQGPYYFAERELNLLKLVAAQLGRYWSNWLGRRAEERRYRSDIVKMQAETYQDLSHQLISPVMQAHRRAQSLAASRMCPEELLPQAYRIRGLCAKAGRVVRNTRLFAELASGRLGHVKLMRLPVSDLLKMLAEAAEDSSIMVDPGRCLEFKVLRDGFNSLPPTLELDMDLASQAVNNLLDNASKYSYPLSTISISVGATQDRFYISITNRGIRIRPDEVRKAVERGWRGEGARKVTGEGSGIGLWVVENVMRAHGGEFLITPTTPDGLTDFKLVFPIWNRH
jgi:signal transduction histidine kinase